jgi:dTDP-4-dehydrorhamnose 3,5-epimerase
MIDGVIFSPLSIIGTDGGDVLHALKSSDNGFSGFGEAYFSKVEPRSIKGWKLHHEMVLNLIVAVGIVRFVIFDERPKSPTKKEFNEFILSLENYGRLTVPPKVWVGFQGLSESTSIVLNIASIEHSPDEIDRKLINEIIFDWKKN